MSEIEIDIVHRAGIKHQATVALLRLKTKRTGKTTLDDEVSVPAVSQAFFRYAPQMEITYFEFIEKSKVPFVPVSSEFFIMAGISDNDKAEIQTLADFLSAQSSDVDYRAPFVSIGKRNSRSNLDSDEMLV